MDMEWAGAASRRRMTMPYIKEGSEKEREDALCEGGKAQEKV